ncbi:IS3 family transposase [Paenibacillus larvae]|nr:IS3 family transposase [Paenibacillus larvae]MDT2258884.1 IS3 family transposase [Paenibacillus larvae]
MDETQGKRTPQTSQKLERWIRRTFFDSRQLYGSPKVWYALKKQGIHVSQKTVARIMKELGLRSRTVKKYKATTNSKHNLARSGKCLESIVCCGKAQSGLDGGHHVYSD